MVTESLLVVSLRVKQRRARLERIYDECRIGEQDNKDLDTGEMRISRSTRNNNTRDKLTMWSGKQPRVTTTEAGEAKPCPLQRNSNTGIHVNHKSQKSCDAYSRPITQEEHPNLLGESVASHCLEHGNRHFYFGSLRH